MSENEPTESAATESEADGTDNVQHADWIGPGVMPADAGGAGPEEDWVGPSALPADEEATDPEQDWVGPT